MPTDKLTKTKSATTAITTYNITLNYLPPTRAI